MTGQPDLRVSCLEAASCVVVGAFEVASEHVGQPAGDPVVALERAVIPALQRAPCLVSFSGGQDSSLVLAAAVRTARREQLPLPIPVSWQPTDAPHAEESAWQQLVVDALEVTDWLRLPTGDDLDFVGPVATQVLRRHGVLFPANAYFHAPLLEQAAGGSLLTGFGGDQVLGRLSRPRRPAWWPQPTPSPPTFGWLRPAAARSVRRNLRREARARPRSYDGRPAWALTRRDLELARLSLDLLGGDTDTKLVHPLLDPAFLAALCSSGPSPEAAGGRSRLLAQVFGREYPERVLRWRPKARFGEVFWRRHSRSVVVAWDGTGIDLSVVDRAELRREWSKPHPDSCTAMLAQQVRLAQCPPSVEVPGMDGEAAWPSRPR
jgi:hypothetical protein